MKECIKKLYGSVDNMLEITDTFISRSYIYQIINGDTNITLKVAAEIKDLLDLDTLEDVVNLLENENNV